MAVGVVFDPMTHAADVPKQLGGLVVCVQLVVVVNVCKEVGLKLGSSLK